MLNESHLNDLKLCFRKPVHELEKQGMVFGPISPALHSVLAATSDFTSTTLPMIGDRPRCDPEQPSGEGDIPP